MLNFVTAAVGFLSLVQDPAVSQEEPVLYTVVEATHERLVFDTDVTTIAVGRSETLSVEILNSRELLALGLAPGRTSLIVWFADGSTQTLLFAVEPDLSILRSALRELHPSITAEIAPDRDAVVLRGLVPDVTTFRAAERAATAYLDSQGTSVLVTSNSEDEGDSEVQLLDQVAPNTVINLIRLEELPPMSDERIQAAIRPLTGENVTARRVQVGSIPDDEVDSFVLEGTVPDQVTLSRLLFLASHALVGQADNRNDIRVLTDESGALTNVTQVFGAGNNAGGGGGGNNNGLNIGGQSQGGGRNSGAARLANRIGSNLGRAKAIEAAEGRILSMVEVEHLPLVRVDVRIYEVNLTRLRQWGNDLAAFHSDFNQSPLTPTPLAQSFQGANASSVGQDDVQNIFGFLGGQLFNQSQLVTGGFALENFFTLLVQEQIARSISRPTLTVLSGELAQFQVGGQVPIPVAVTVGGGTDQILRGIEFRDFGVQLAVRPLVEELNSETITLDLQPTVSLPDLDLTAAIGAVTDTNTGATAFETRGTRTHTRLRDGQAMLLGGLVTQREETAQRRIPGVGDVPGAGWLFRNEADNAEDFELVIVVNPVIVRSERTDARQWMFTESGSVLDHCLDAVGGASRESENLENPGTANEREALGR